MRIAINCRSFLNKNCTGIGRYTLELIKALSVIDRENEYALYAPKGFLTLHKRLSHLRSKNFSFKIDLFHRGLEKTVGSIDLYHSPSPEYLNGISSKVVVTVHDLIFRAYPEGHTAATIRVAEDQFQHIVGKASKIICCSESTRRDLKRYFPVADDKAVLIYQGVNHDDFYPIDEKEGKRADKILRSLGIARPYLLFVGTIEPRKNLKNLFAAYRLLKEKKRFTGKLVLAGMKGWLTEGLFSYLEELGIEKDIQRLGFVSNQVLRYLYNQAEVFVFPSFYEGFGFPIVEAFSCGAAVVTSHVSSCPEIAGDAALTVDPNSPQHIAEAIGRILEEGGLREELRGRALKRADDFSFSKTARQTLAVYQEVYRR